MFPVGLSLLLVGGPATAQQNPEDFIEEIEPEEPEEPEDPPPAKPPTDDVATTPPPPGNGREPGGIADPEGAPADPPGPGDGKRPGGRPGRGKPGKGPPEPPADPPSLPSSDDGVVVRQLSYAGLLERWDAWRTATNAREPAKIRRAETLFEEGMDDLGLHGMKGGLQAPDLAYALVVESREALAAAEDERARRLAELAIKAAPDAPAVYTWQADLELRIGSPPAAVQNMLEAGRALLRSPRHLASVAARAFAALGLVTLLLLFVFSGVYLIRGFRYLVFDLWAALPRGAARWQVFALVGIAAVVPILAGAGPVLCAFIWLTLGWLYLERRDMVAAWLVGALTLSLPLVVGLGARLFSYQGSSLDRAYLGLTDVAAETERASFAKDDADQGQLAALVGLAEADFREGRLESAMDRWRKVVQRSPEGAWAHNNLGVLAAVSGNLDLAQAAFRDALSRDGGYLIAAYNASVLSFRNPRAGKVDAAVTQILDGASSSLESFRAMTHRRPDAPATQNRAFVWAPMPRTVLADLWREPPEAAASFEAELSKLLYLGLRPWAAAGLMGFFLLLWMVLARLKSRLLPSRACTRCGNPASLRYDGPEVPRDSCSSCYHAFISPRSSVDSSMRLSKERQVVAHRRARARAATFFSLLFAGAGHLYQGAALKGLAYALVYALALGGLAVVGLGFLPWPSPPGSVATWYQWGPPLVVAVLVYVVALRGASRQGG